MSFSSLNNTFFGPLNSEFCNYFYIISFISLVSIFFICVPAIFVGIKRNEKFGFYLSIISMTIMYIIGYFTNRLLYTMCLSSTKR